MVEFDDTRGTLPRLQCERYSVKAGVLFGDAKQGAAWLSSARAVRCWVKSRNERNPYFQLPTGKAGDSSETAYASSEEGGDDVKSSWPLCLGLHTCYNGEDKG